MNKPRIFHGEMRLTKPIAVRLPDTEYRKLMNQVREEEGISDVLRKIIAKHNETINVK